MLTFAFSGIDIDILLVTIYSSAALFCYITLTWLWDSNDRHRLPPGPKGWPIVGNAFDLPKEHEWKAYRKWCQQYDTDILYLNMVGTPVIILDTYEATFELFEKRSSIYSGRSRMPMINELMGWDFDMLFADYGERWRQHRKLMHQSFNPLVVNQYRPVQLKAARKLILNFCDTNDVIAELRQMSGETIISVTYGIDVLPKNDPYIEAAERSIHTLLEAIVPGKYLVDFIPALKNIPEWVPGAGFKRIAKESRRMANMMVNLPFETMAQAMTKGTVKPCFSLDGLQRIQAGEGGIYTEENVKSVAGALYQTGSDTTVSAITFCIISLLDHPEVMKKAQAEIDSITDCARLPDFMDEESLPYITAFIKETLRFWSIAPLAMPHHLHEEDFYNGYRLPAGSLVVANSWAVLHNPDVYKDPFNFNPDRFLDNDKTVNDHFDAIWGYGRRICPGRFFALASVFITVASILAVYDLEKAKDENGKDIEPALDFPASVLLFPPRFPCSISVRSPSAEHILASLAQDIDLL